MRHKHRWRNQGIVSQGYRIGMTHRMCGVKDCLAEMYEYATPAEFRKHDPLGTVKRNMRKMVGLP